MNFMKKNLQDKTITNFDEIVSPKSLENQKLTCLDDTILKEFRDDLLNDKDKSTLFKTVKELQYGENFGCKFKFLNIFLTELGLDFGQHDSSSPFYYISDSACQLGVISNKVFKKSNFCIKNVRTRTSY